MQERQGGSGGAKPPQENFLRFDNVIVTFCTKFGGVNEHLFDFELFLKWFSRSFVYRIPVIV